MTELALGRDRARRRDRIGAGPVVTVASRQPAHADAAEPAPRADPAAHAVERLLLSPAAEKGGRVAMGVTMAFTLIIMS
jgi:hypothetical protein